MSYFQFMVPDTWNGHRDVDEKLNYEELNKYLEDEEDGEAEGEDNNHNDNSPPRNLESQQTQLTNK